MNKDLILNKIISGRSRVNLGGSFLFILEPTSKIIAKSYEIYEETYDKAYLAGLYIDDEIKELLIEKEIWFPYQEKEIEEVKKQLDNKKVDAYQNVLNPKQLRYIKMDIQNILKKMSELFSRKSYFSHLTCHHAAESARWQWIISNCSRYNGKKINPEDFDVYKLFSLYQNSQVSTEQIRAIARYEYWKVIWSTNKIQGGLLFGKNPVDYSKDQLSLCSYTMMYDNVMEHPESPDEKVINDDDCLDGWFIFQRRKMEKIKKTKAIDDGITNEKIKNSHEIFRMAHTQEEIEAIKELNDEQNKAIIRQREKTIAEKGMVNQMDLPDVKLGIQLATNNAMFKG